MPENEWDLYWAQQGRTGACLPGAPPEVQTQLIDGWQEFARRLSEGAKVLDIASGTGAVLRAMTEARKLQATGVDLAAPVTEPDGFDLKTGIDAGNLPFDDDSFDAVVSQFGIEYSGPDAVGETLRVARPGAAFRLVVHHAESVIMKVNGMRLSALDAIVDADILSRAAEGKLDRPATRKEMETYWRAHRKVPVVEEIAAAIDAVLAGPEDAREAEWARLSNGMATERRILTALTNAALGESEAAAMADSLKLPAPIALMLDSEEKMKHMGPLAWLFESPLAV